ncbi:stimulated by retinoic acid gene 6 protein-like [Protopterus annectens]|uniref:stimulated by retinoic acid gene 6 protein-like n=1 Tax=Protopterus annectens TaxID=7888 RepID=UPI001CFA0D8C|nr:stimulated by retinoic acid gene 6 protein-like [Protopterus annectens]
MEEIFQYFVTALTSDSSNETVADNSTTTCKSPLSEDYFHFFLIPSVFIAVVVSFLEKRPRENKLDEKLPCLNQRFRILEPLRFVNSNSHRWIHGVSFGATSLVIILMFLNAFQTIELPTWAKAFTYLINSLEVGMLFYPYFICLTTESKIIPSILGCLFSMSWFSVNIADLLYCPGDESTMVILLSAPSLACSVIIILYFLFTLGIELLKCGNLKKKVTAKKEYHFMNSEKAKHVKRIFEAKKHQNLKKSWFREKVYDWDPFFKFPTRIIMTLTLSFICLFIFIAVIQNKAVGILEFIKQLVELNTSPKLERAYNIFEKGWYITSAVAIASTIMSSLYNLVSYKNQMKMLYKGQRNFLPIAPLPLPRNLLASSMRYSGNQIAYVLWGYVVLHLTLYAAVLAFCFFIVIPIMNGEILKIVEKLGFILVGLIIVFAVIYAQLLAAHFFFLQDKVNPEDSYKPLALNNRRLFNNFNYFILFYSVVVGITACIKRLVIGMVVGCVFLSRIDRSILPSGFQSFDSGYSTWVGMLFVDFCHENPVVVTFCDILSEMQQEKQLRNAPEMMVPELYQDHNICCIPGLLSDHRRKWRTKWLVVYTLVNNPKLIIERKQSAFKTAKVELEDLSVYVNVRNRKEKEAAKKI